MKKKLLSLLLVCALMLTVAGTVEDAVETPEGRSIADWITNLE